MKSRGTYVNDFARLEIVSLITQALKKKLPLSVDDITVPPERTMGDFAFPCFSLAKDMRQNPAEIARTIQKDISQELVSRIIAKVEAAGPYLNFFVNEKEFAKLFFDNCAKHKGAYGTHILGGKQTVLFEFSQPNTHKNFHIGHLRGTVLGDARRELYKNAGYKVIAANYLGDVGAHIAKIIWALEKFHKNENPKTSAGTYLGSIYREAVEKLKAHPELKNEVNEIQQKLEKGDKKLTALWKKTRKWSLDEFNAIYKELGVRFTKVYYESEMEKPGKKIVEELLKKKIAKKSDGAIIVDLKQYGLDVLVILKSDETSLYATKDLALALKKSRDYTFDESIVQTDVRQTLYFKQIFKILELMGVHGKQRHLTYAMVRLPEGAMSSRSGAIVSYDELKAQLFGRAKRETAKRHPDWPEKKVARVAASLTSAVMKFEMVKQAPDTIITFDIKHALSFDGFTAPYLLYTLARIHSIIRKTKWISQKGDATLLIAPEEKTLIKKLAEYPDITKESLESHNPATLVHFLHDVAKTFTTFYHAHKVLDENKELQYARLVLLFAVKQILENGLNVLGIQSIEEM